MRQCEIHREPGSNKRANEAVPEDEKFRMRVHGFSETMLRVHTFPVALTTMMVNQLVTMCRWWCVYLR